MTPEDPKGPEAPRERSEQTAAAREALTEREGRIADLKRAAVPLGVLLVAVLSIGLLSDLLRRTGGPSESPVTGSTVNPVTPEQLEGRVPRPPTSTTAPSFAPSEPVRRRTEPSRRQAYGGRAGRAPEPTRRPRLVARGLAEPPARSVAAPKPISRSPEVRDLRRLKRGTTLHARLERDVSSESFASAVVARLTYPVYEADTGRLVFPEQTELHGVVSRDPALGSTRVGIRWHEAILPTSHGSGVVSLDQPGSDSAGVEGVGTDVSHRWGSFYGHAAVMSVLSALVQGAQQPEGGNARVEAYGAAELARQSEEVTRSVLRRLQDRRPRFHLPRGSRVAVQVERTLEVPAP